jgi:hypothetical protein
MFAVPHSLVRPAGVAELLVGALLGDPAVVEDHDVVDLVQPVSFMGDEQDRTALSGVQQVGGEHRHTGQGAGPGGGNAQQQAPQTVRPVTALINPVTVRSGIPLSHRPSRSG